MKLNSWYSLAVNARKIPIDNLISVMGSLPARSHLKYIRVLYEKIKDDGLSRNNVCDLITIIRNHLVARNYKALELDRKTPNHWAKTRLELLKNWKFEREFVETLLKNVKIESILNNHSTPILQVWGHLGAADKLKEYKSNFSLSFHSNYNVLELIHSDIVANGLAENLKRMELTFDYYHSAKLKSNNLVYLEYCKFSILNNQKNMISLLVNSNKFTTDQLYEYLILPLYASNSPYIFVSNFERIPSHVKTKLLGDVRVRIMVLQSYIALRRFREIFRLVKTTDPQIINQNLDILDGLYCGFKSMIERRRVFVNLQEKKDAFNSIPVKRPNDVTELYPLMDVCYTDLEEELKLARNLNDADHGFMKSVKLRKAFHIWAEHYLTMLHNSNEFIPTKEDFQLIVKAIMNSSITMQEVESSLIVLSEAASHLNKWPLSDETVSEINSFFNMARYIPSKWKLQLNRLKNKQIPESKSTIKLYKSPLLAKFRYALDSKHVDNANSYALQLLEEGFNFLESSKYFLMLVNLNIKFKQFGQLRLLFRSYVKYFELKDDPFYYNTVFSMVKSGLFVEAAELIEDMATSVNVLPESLMIHDFIYNLSKLPDVNQKLLKSAQSVFAYLHPGRYTGDIVEQMIFIASNADKNLDVALQMFNISLEHKVKLGNWSYQHLLHIFSAHKRDDLVLQVIQTYIPQGDNIMPVNIAFEHFLSIKDLEKIKEVLRMVRKSSLEFDAFSHKWILKGFAYLDSNMEKAESLWESVQSKSLAYSDSPSRIMITGYSRMQTEEADQKMVQMVAELMDKIHSPKMKFRVIHDVVLFMVGEGFVECADYFLAVMHEKLNVFSTAEIEYILFAGYLETKNVPMILQSFYRLLECVEDQSFSSGKIDIYESLVEGLNRIGQTDLANKYKQEALSLGAQY